MSQDDFTLVTKKSKIRKKANPEILEFSKDQITKQLQFIHFPQFQFLDKLPKIPIVCYGLGPLSHRASVIQLKFLLLLQQQLDSPVWIFDPISTTSEIEYFTNSLHFKWLPDFKVFKNVFYFMIHCEHYMYRELEKEKPFIVLGNDLSEYGMVCTAMDVDFGDYSIEFYHTRLHFVE